MTDDLPATLDELTVQQEDFAQMYAKCGNATRSYIATYGTKGDASKVAVRIAASRLANNPAVAARIHALRTAIAEQFVISAAALQLRQYEVATAPPLTHVRVFACRHCHGIGGKYAWRDAEEFTDAVEHWAATRDTRPQPQPSPAGGFSFNPFASPNPECVHCLGAGVVKLYMADTTHLEGAAAASYAGASIDKYGVITLRQHDAQDAAHELHRMIPGAIAPARTESKSLTVHVEPLRDMTPQQVIEFMQQQKLLT
jgi:phage terminase small subunit